MILPIIVRRCLLGTVAERPFALAVYGGDAIGTLTPIASDHGGPCCSGGPWLRFDATPARPT
jgi:hypothetical protein